MRTHTREHLATDKASRIYKHNHLKVAEMCAANSFSVIDYAFTSFQLKIKESLQIHWDKPTLNKQVKHINLKLYV